MIRFVKAILGIGGKKTKTQARKTPTRNQQTRAAIKRDYLEEVVSETAFAARAEQVSAKTRYRHLDDCTLERIISEAINSAQHEARTNACHAATNAWNKGKGRIYIVRVGKESGQKTYRKAIDRAIQRNQAGKRVQPNVRRAAVEKTYIRTVSARQREKVQAAARREQKRLEAKETKSGQAESAQKVAKRPVASQSNHRMAAKAAKHKPGIHSQSSTNDTYASRTKRSKQTREANQLRDELDTLKDRHRLLTRKMRDVTFRGGKKSKNADYHDTKEQLIAVEERIQFYANALASAMNSRSKSTNDIVQVGSTVLIRYDDSDKAENYTIVSTPLLKSSERTISANSPTGSALLGKRKGDKVRVQTPDGSVKLRVIDIRYT